MSHDYYLVCKEKKIYMPMFTTVFGNCGFTDKRYTFDFILECGGSQILLVDENSDDYLSIVDEDTGEEATGWKFINAWQEYRDK